MALISPYVTLRAAWPLPGVGFFGPSSGFYCIGYSVFTLFRVTHTSVLPASRLSFQDSPEPRLVPREGLNTYILSLCTFSSNGKMRQTAFELWPQDTFSFKILKATVIKYFWYIFSTSHTTTLWSSYPHVLILMRKWFKWNWKWISQIHMDQQKHTWNSENRFQSCHAVQTCWEAVKQL